MPGGSEPVTVDTGETGVFPVFGSKRHQNED
jgi:hypothetical protein